MKNELFLSNEQTMSSREIAELTGKQHKHVLRDCDVLNESYDKLHLLKIEEMFSIRQLPNNGSIKDRYYQLTRMQTFDLMTGYNTEIRIKVNRRWEELETKNKYGLTTPNRKQLAQWVIELEEQTEKQTNQIIALTKKTQLMDKVLDADEKIDIGQASKILELPFGRNTLFQKLREMGIFFKNRNEPKQEFIEKGYFQLKEKFIERNNHEGFVIIKILVTQRGLEFLANRFMEIPAQKLLANFE